MRRQFARSLRRHWRKLLASCGIFAVLIGALIAFWPDPLEERVKRIQPGMIETEVERVMGVLPGNYSHYGEVRRGGIDPDADRMERWMWDDATVNVWFDRSGRVTRSEYRRHQLSLLDRLGFWFD
jgi:hypothetical protein